MQYDHPLTLRPEQPACAQEPGGEDAFQLHEARLLLGRLRSAGRGLARSILHEICDFANSVKRGIHHANEIDAHVREQRHAREEEWIRNGIHPRWPNF